MGSGFAREGHPGIRDSRAPARGHPDREQRDTSSPPASRHPAPHRLFLDSSLNPGVIGPPTDGPAAPGMVRSFRRDPCASSHGRGSRITDRNPKFTMPVGTSPETPYGHRHRGIPAPCLPQLRR